MMLTAILMSLLAIRFINAAEGEGISSGEIAYSSPSEPHITKSIIIHGRPIYIRPLFGRPTYMRPLRPSSRASAFAKPLNRASSGGTTYKERPPQYLSETVPCIPQGTAVYDQLPLCEPPRRQYPLPQCYTNKSGFMCCNRKLESEMRLTFNQLKSSQQGPFKTCNIQKIANIMQANLQRSFNTSFETVAAISDFASKIHFFSDYACKLEIDGRYMLAYGTPRRSLPPPSYNVDQAPPPTYDEQGPSPGPYAWSA